jgi:uncharacterized protein YbbC (DUF1343 family)
MQVFFGVDRLLAQHPHWKNESLGLLTNHAATTREGTPAREALLRHGFGLQVIFSPEHGLDVQGADGAAMEDGKDWLTGLPVKSLYRQSFAPDRDDVKSLDRIIFDVPDVGARFYTYLWSLTYLMEACATAGKPLVVLDRPNPISGLLELAEGPMLEEEQSSFIGRWPIPIRHSCTLGELALYFNATFKIGVDLEVIACSGWERSQFQPDWGTPFVATSPAIRQFEAMVLYPGLCLLEATNICEGRGTSQPFMQFGAPWMDGSRVAKTLYDLSLDDVSLEPVRFTPDAGKLAGIACNGVRCYLTDTPHFQPVYWGLLLIKIIKDLYPNDFCWATYPTLANPSGTNHLNKLLGIPNSEAIFNLPMPAFLSTITRLTQVQTWNNRISNYLLYN